MTVPIFNFKGLIDCIRARCFNQIFWVILKVLTYITDFRVLSVGWLSKS